MPLDGGKFIAFEILGGDIPGVVAGAGAAADLQAPALPQCVEGEAAVPAHDHAVLVDDVTRRGGNVTREEFPERSLADEADAGAIRLVEHRQSRFARQRAHLRLGQFAERKHHLFEVPAVDAVQEIGLILVGVARLHEHRSRRSWREPRIMAGGEAPRAETSRVVETHAELDFPIAQHVGIGCAARAILGVEVVKHARAVLFGKTHPVQRDAELTRGGARVLEVLRARAIVVVIVPVAHVEPVHVEAGALEQQRRHGGVHSAGHADDNSFPGIHGADSTSPGGESRGGLLQVDDRGRAHRRLQVQAGHRVEGLLLAEQEIIDAAHDQRRAQASGLREQFVP